MMARLNYYFTGYRLVMPAIVAAIALWSAMCNNGPKPIVHPNGKAFAGSESCQSCHRDIYASHLQTAHYRTSRPASVGNVEGSFGSGKNIFVMNDSVQAVMEKTDSGLFQVAYVHGKETARHPIDITMGSGRKGQTYLYWAGNYLFQLPVSYYSPGNEWCNSPGYPTGRLIFNRTVPGGCIECHGTYLAGQKDLLGKTEYDRSSIIYGVDCERCHGPGAEHVAFQTGHPELRQAKYIVNPANLSRQQQLDNCALCHSGIRSRHRPSFSYVTGDKLEDYSSGSAVNDSTAPLDVHGNQYGLLAASKCFRISKIMTCSTCHDAHANQAGNLAAFSQKCMSCHNGKEAVFCPKAMHSMAGATANCIDCHMPSLPSKKIFLELSSKKEPVPALIRTHLIAKYSTQKLADIKSLIDNFRQ